MPNRIVSVDDDFRLPDAVRAQLLEDLPIPATPADIGAQPAGDYATPTGVATSIAAAVKTAIDKLITGAPGTLDTLDELAAALGDDANFAATVSAALAARATLVGGKVPDNQLPDRLQDVVLRAAFVSARVSSTSPTVVSLLFIDPLVNNLVTDLVGATV